MTLAEFKAWFEGFTEDMAARPTDKQWKRIKARVKEIDGTAITREVIYRNWPWYWNGAVAYTAAPIKTLCNTSAGLDVAGNVISHNAAAGERSLTNGGSYLAAQDLNAIGKAEYQESLAALI